MTKKNKKSPPQAEKMTLDKLGRITQQGFLEVDKKFGEVDKKLLALDTKIDVKTEKLDNRLMKVEFELREVKTDVKWMKENFNELFTKLDKFIALYEKQEQEMLMLGVQLQKLEERISKLESKQLEKHTTK